MGGEIVEETTLGGVGSKKWDMISLICVRALLKHGSITLNSSDSSFTNLSNCFLLSDVMKKGFFDM